MRTIYLLVIITLLFSCSRDIDNRTAIVIPSGYSGPVCIFFDVHGMLSVEEIRNFVFFPTNGEGFMLTSSKYDSTIFDVFVIFEKRDKDFKIIHNSYFYSVSKDDSTRFIAPRIDTSIYFPKEGKKLIYFAGYILDYMSVANDSLTNMANVEIDKHIENMYKIIQSRKSNVLP